MTVTPVTVRTLGALETSVGGLARRRKPFVLLTYLLLAGGREYHQRDALTALFWPNSSDHRARASLRQALVTIEKALGPILERRGTEELRVRAGRVRIDVSDLLDAVAREKWVEALGLYRGPFLDAVHLHGVPALERWIDVQQLRVAEAYRTALAGLEAGPGGRPPMDGSPLWAELSRRAPIDAASARALADVVASPRGPGPERTSPRQVGATERPRSRRSRTPLAAGSMVALCALLVVGIVAAPSAAPPADRTRVAISSVLVPDDVEGGLSDALSLVLGREITRIESIELLPPSEFIAGDSKEHSLERASEQGVDVLVRGSLSSGPQGGRLTVEVLDVASRRPVRAALTAEVPVGASPSDAMRELGERVTTVVASGYAPPAAIRGDHATRADVPRYPAYAEFSRGLAAFERGEYARARRHARAAQTIDTSYVSARIEVAIQHANLGAWEAAGQALDSARSAYPYIGDWDRGRFDWLEAVLAGDREGRVRISLESEGLMTPFQRAFELANVGQLRGSISILDAGSSTEPGDRSSNEFWLRTVNLHRLGRHLDEEREARRYRQADPEARQPLRLIARAQAARGDVEAARGLIERAEKPAWPYLDAQIAQEVGIELLAHGREGADEWLELALERFGATPLTGNLEAARIRTLLARGRWAQARRGLNGLTDAEMSPLERLGSMAIVDARTGRRVQARSAAMDLEKGHPASAGDRKLWEARIAAALGEESRVPGLLREATRLGAARPGWVHSFPEWRFLRDRGPLDAWLAPS